MPPAVTVVDCMLVLVLVRAGVLDMCMSLLDLATAALEVKL